MIIGFGLNSEAFLNKGAKLAIEKSGLDIKFGEIKGGLFSGVEIKDFNYQDDVKADLKLDMDFAALKEGTVRVKDVNISHLSIDKDFLATLMKPGKSNENSQNSESMIKMLEVDNLHLDAHNIAYENYMLDALVLDIKGFKTDMKESFYGDIKARIESNVARADITAKLEDKNIDAHMAMDVKKEFVQPYLKDSNVTLEDVPHVVVDMKGTKSLLMVDATIGEGVFYFQDITINPKHLDIHADIGVKSGDIKSRIKGEIDSDFASLALDVGSSLNLNDINHTLAFDIKSKILADDAYVRGILGEQNATVEKMPTLFIHAKGDTKRVALQSRLESGEVHYQDFEIFPKKLNLDAKYDVEKQNIEATLISRIDSNAADVDLKSFVMVNLDDINSTLRYTSKGEIIAQSAYLKSHIKEANITLDRLSPLSLMIKGDAKALDGVFSLDGEARFNDLVASPALKNSTVHFDLVSKDVKSAIHAYVKSNKGDLSLNSDVALNIEDINDTLAYKADISIKDTKAFAGVDLSSLGDIMISAKGSLKALKAKVHSKKIKATVTSADFDTFKLNLDTKKIYIGKVYEDVPPDLKKSFVALRGSGFYKLSLKEAKIKAKLKGFKYNNKTLFTNDFTLALKGDDVRLSPLVLQSDKFKVTVSATKVGDDLVATVKNKAFSAKANVKLDPLNVHADGEISSIEGLLKEANKVMPVDTEVGIDGSVKFRVRMQGESVRADITSKKITLPEGRAEKLHILALYEPHRVQIKNFDFKLAGFQGKEMNRQVRLAREGLITFDEENATVDVELDNLLSFKGQKKGDVTTGSFKTNKLALSYPNYGHTKITTNLEMFQSNGKMAVTGEVRFYDTEVTYQSQFMDISKDSDIIILSEKKKEEDTFMKNTFLDIKIASDDAIIYKMDEGEIEMKPDIIVRKDFNQAQKITGKIKILDGMYDYADKRFRLKEGAVAFRGQADPNPLLDLHVEYDEIEDVLIMIKIGGDKNRPKLEFSSTPQMSKKDIFSYLLFGMSASETEGAATSANKAAERIFGRAIAKDLARELHLDRLDMNRNKDGGIDVKAGKKVKKNTFVYYQNKNTESSVILERKLSKSWEMTTELGKLGQSVDLVFRKGFK